MLKIKKNKLKNPFLFFQNFQKIMKKNNENVRAGASDRCGRVTVKCKFHYHGLINYVTTHLCS